MISILVKLLIADIKAIEKKKLSSALDRYERVKVTD